jgi:hypothetical protein
MSKQAKDVGRIRLDLVDGLPEKIWSKIGNYDTQIWRLPPNKALLASLVGGEETFSLYAMTDSAKRNIHLRTLLSKPLRSKNEKVRLAAIKWVVYSWGRVRGKRGSEEVWPEQLKNYSTTVVDEFIKTQKNKRVASWSKVLAFVDSSKYAIYDARVAVTLNSVLDEISNDNRFFMPPPSAGDLPQIFQEMKVHVAKRYVNKRPMYLGYREYMDLLNVAVEKKLAINVLDAEMRLFANFDIYANKYAARHGMKIPYPKLL